MKHLHIAAFLLTLLTGVASIAHAASEKGWFGFGLTVEADGLFFNPTLRVVKINSVVPSSPAASAGLLVGDLVLEVQGILVAGSKANTLKAASRRSVGETLRIQVKSGAAEPYELSIIAIAKPSGV